MVNKVFIFVGVVAVTLALFKLVTRPHPATAAGDNQLKAINAELLATLPKPLRTMKNGDEGYISLSDIESHPLLNVMIQDDTMVSPAETPDHPIHITIANNIIVLDPVSVTKAIRYVAFGPVTETHKQLMTSTTFLNGIPTVGSASPDAESVPAPQPGKER